MGGKHSRNKGAKFERDIAKLLRDRGIFPKAKRHLEFQAEEAALGRDIDNTGEYGIQCKAYKQYAPIAKIEEVKEGKPILITKGDFKIPTVTMYIGDWLDLMEEVWKQRDVSSVEKTKNYQDFTYPEMEKDNA